MALKADMNKAKQKAAEEAARAASFGTFGTLKFWKAKKGKNRIRIMPPWTAEGTNALQWWREVWVHWGIGPDEDNKQTLACPRKTPPGDQSVACPICDEADRLRKTGDPADLEASKQMRAKMRVYANIIDMKDQTWTEDDIEELKAGGVEEDNLPSEGDPKIQVFSFGATIFKDLLDYYTDELDMTDLENGRIVIITREGDGLNTDYRVRTEQENSKAPVPDDEPKLHNLDNIMQVKSEAELKAILEGVDPEEVKKLEAASKKSKDKQKKLAAASKAQDESEDEDESGGDEDEGEGGEDEDGDEGEGEGGDEDEGGDEGEGGDEDQEEEEKPKPKPAAKAPPGKKPPAKKEDEDWPPVDADGYLDFDKLTDEQIEDKQNAAVQDSNGTSVYIQCFGAARQRDEDDAACADQCPLFKRCGKRIAALDAAEKAKKAPGKPVPGKALGKAPGKPKKDESDVDELEAQMRGAVKGGKK